MLVCDLKPHTWGGNRMAAQLELKKLIVSDPKIMMGKPVIAGTRIPVELI